LKPAARTAATEDTPLKIEKITVTPIAIQDPPLLNVLGIHQPYALRSIIEVTADNGLVGLAETYGDSNTLNGLNRVSELLAGLDPFCLNDLEARVERGLAGMKVKDGSILAPGTIPERAKAIAFAAYETACLDLQGKLLGLPVAEVLGGRVRDAVPFSAYLFYKKARHLGAAHDDPYGGAETPEAVVRQARKFVAEYGFKSLKLKGGVYEPAVEIETMRQLKKAFPDHPLRLDPNGGWTVKTAIAAARELEGVLEYLEDPVLGFAESAEVAHAISMPIATNMVVVSFQDMADSVRHGSVQVILSDHHYWGGMRATQALAKICSIWKLGLSMHSNSHLGISLVAMAHVAAACTNLTYACDTHYPWQQDEVIAGGKLKFIDGALPVPTKPGLGVDLDRDALTRLHRQYLACKDLDRDDVKEMRKYDPNWKGALPRF
jgi:glucarate dehydratase